MKTESMHGGYPLDDTSKSLFGGTIRTGELTRALKKPRRKHRGNKLFVYLALLGHVNIGPSVTAFTLILSAYDEAEALKLAHERIPESYVIDEEKVVTAKQAIRNPVFTTEF